MSGDRGGVDDIYTCGYPESSYFVGLAIFETDSDINPDTFQPFSSDCCLFHL